MEAEAIKFSVTLTSPAVCIEWSPAYPDFILIILRNSNRLLMTDTDEIKLLNLKTKAVSNLSFQVS